MRYSGMVSIDITFAVLLMYNNEYSLIHCPALDGYSWLMDIPLSNVAMYDQRDDQ